MKCAHCQTGRAKRRGLCYRCHADRSIRDRYPSRFVIRKHEGPRCLHCSIRKQKRQSRGLCYRCYLDPSVRGQFVKKNKVAVKAPDNCLNGCGQRAYERNRGLCRRCYRDKSIRERFPKRHIPKGVRSHAGKIGDRSNLKPCQPTKHLPGTPELLEVRRLRVLNGEELFHDEDGREDE